MLYVAHEARTSAPTKDGETARAHLEAAARKGNKDAIALLCGPEFPEPLQHLYGWHMELFGRSGVGMDGIAPLSYSTVAHWSDLTGHQPTPSEVEALMALDAVRRQPPKEDETGARDG